MPDPHDAGGKTRSFLDRWTEVIRKMLPPKCPDCGLLRSEARDVECQCEWCRRGA